MRNFRSFRFKLLECEQTYFFEGRGCFGNCAVVRSDHAMRTNFSSVLHETCEVGCIMIMHQRCTYASFMTTVY